MERKGWTAIWNQRSLFRYRRIGSPQRNKPIRRTIQVSSLNNNRASTSSSFVLFSFFLCQSRAFHPRANTRERPMLDPPAGRLPNKSQGVANFYSISSPSEGALPRRIRLGLARATLQGVACNSSLGSTLGGQFGETIAPKYVSARASSTSSSVRREIWRAFLLALLLPLHYVLPR